MKLNVEKFKEFVKKATLNNSIDNVKMTIDKDSIKSGMRGTACITVLNVENDFITGVKGEHEFLFNEPFQGLIRYLDLIDEEECDIQVKNEKIVIKSGKQKSNVFFCASSLITSFDKAGPKDLGELVAQFELSDEFIDDFNKVKKVATNFGKVYFSVEDGKLYIETTDKTNTFSNGVRFELMDSDFGDCDLCIDFKNFNNLMTCINGDYADFTVTLKFIKGQGGLVSVEKEGEKYYLVTKREDTV